MAKKITADYQGTETLEVLQEAKNYNTWIAKSILSFTNGVTLEIGAGIGNLSQYFVHQKKLYVTEIDKTFVKHLDHKFKKYKHIQALLLDITKPVPSTLKQTIDTVFAVNVLEHISQDIVALKQIHTLLKSKGKIVLLVPANQFAYTSLDKSLGHVRRYQKNDLQKKLSQTGFRIEKIYYFNFLGLISWMVRDFLSNKQQLSGWQVSLFDKLVPVLKIIEKHIPPPTGISLIAVATKI